MTDYAQNCRDFSNHQESTLGRRGEGAHQNGSAIMSMGAAK